MNSTPQAPLAFDACLFRWKEIDRMACDAEQRIEAALDSYCAGAGPAPEPRDVVIARNLRRAAVSGFARVLDCVGRARAEVREI